MFKEPRNFETNKINNIMKITIDDELKTIKIEGDVNLKELFDVLKGMEIPLKEYTLMGVEKVIEYIPYYVEKYISSFPVVPPYSPNWPDHTWIVTCDINNSNIK